jgi:hypothetical protein
MNETGWTTPPIGPWGMTRGRKAKALCADGRIRSATATAEPDTYFSVPARVSVRHKTVSGFLMVEGNEWMTFTAYLYGKNADLIVEQEGAKCPS